MMHNFVSVLIIVFLTACTHKPPSLSLRKIAYSPSEITTQTFHAGKEKSYLSLDLAYAPFEKIRKDLEAQDQLQLQHRGEAHITVITPPEFKILQKKVSMKEIETLAAEMGLQKSAPQLLCVGKSSLQISGKMESTYYVVVESERLYQIRKAVGLLYHKKGGKEIFDAENYHPHVTLGFTKRDLHIEDGVKKNASSCLYGLKQN
ncbi:2'-5' RNA ligase family protein [Bdellovibrio reynosensis]|uniref:2'-5' RNA ligase family protein n=1 Tax=Bdellovibrio reynosensis TaxID=2835041 RepID=A0ABY4CAJ8_9BACT|nr:2'-5' RNA ligase family protein [Bdellovibrio reynosensis]UOF01970.1 2'-5' RNA ligase family protein [Bdellovibrio reynosensis]